MTLTTPHTPTPWTIGEDNDVFSEEGCIALVVNAPENIPEAIANAHHIVHCVNTHAALVAALELAQATIHRVFITEGRPFSRIQGTHDVIHQALALARKD